MNEYQVKAHWDEEAKVWWSESDDVPGLCVEALTFEELEKRLSDLIPDLLILNHIIEESDNRPIRFVFWPRNTARQLCGLHKWQFSTKH